MCARKLANKELLPEKSIQRFGNLFPARVILFLAAPNADIETDHAVLIARAHNRNIAVDVILALNNLLRTLRNVGAVGESNVFGGLLLDGDLRAPRRGIRFGGQALRIDLDPADPEEFLHAAAHGRVDGLADDEIGGLIGKTSLARLLLQLLRLLAGATQSQQGDDVRLGQRRLRTIVHIQAIGCPRNGDVEIVVANVSGRLQVDLRLNRDGIGKRNIAALQAELDSVEGGVAFQNVGAAENARARHRPVQAQISISGEPRHCGLHLQFGSGTYGHVQLTLYSGEFAGVIAADWRLRSRYEPKSKPGVTASFVTRMSPETIEAERFPTQCSSAVAVELTPGGYRRRTSFPTAVRLKLSWPL